MPRRVCWFVLGLAGCMSPLPESPEAHRERPVTRARPEPAPHATAEATTTILPKSDAGVRQAAASEPATTNPQSIEQLHAAAAARFAEAPSFVARLRRRETLQGKAKPEELMLFKERKNPYGIHFKWIGEAFAGREVLYVRGKYGDKLNVVTATGDVPFTPAGQRMTFARDNILVKAANPNHDVADAGLAFNLQDLAGLYAAAGNPASGVTTKLLGMVNRPEYPYPLSGVEIQLPPGRDPDIPRGGRREVFYCPKCKLPVLFLCWDETGREQNYNCFDRIQLNLPLDDDDFDPDKLWGKRPAPTAKP